MDSFVTALLGEDQSAQREREREFIGTESINTGSWRSLIPELNDLDPNEVGLLIHPYARRRCCFTAKALFLVESHLLFLLHPYYQYRESLVQESRICALYSLLKKIKLHVVCLGWTSPLKGLILSCKLHRVLY